MSDFKEVIAGVEKLFRKHHLDYDQSRYVFKEVRKALELKPTKGKGGSIKRLSKEDLNKFLRAANDSDVEIGLMMNTLYETGARVDEFVNFMVSDLMRLEEKIVVREGKGGKVK